jgi:hypothetical protein
LKNISAQDYLKQIENISAENLAPNMSNTSGIREKRPSNKMDIVKLEYWSHYFALLSTIRDK